MQIIPSNTYPFRCVKGEIIGSDLHSSTGEVFRLYAFFGLVRGYFLITSEPPYKLIKFISDASAI